MIVTIHFNESQNKSQWDVLTLLFSTGPSTRCNCEAFSIMDFAKFNVVQSSRLFYLQNFSL
jgi:hypothetical protein